MKKSELDKQAIKDMMYGSLKELGRNQNFYYHSGFGHKYSHIRDEGRDLALSVLQDFVEKILELEERIYDERKKHDTVEALRGTNGDS